MALFPCKDCGTCISFDASRCPKCGCEYRFDNRPLRPGTKKVLTFLCGLVIIASLIGTLFPDHKAEEARQAQERFMEKCRQSKQATECAELWRQLTP